MVYLVQLSSRAVSMKDFRVGAPVFPTQYQHSSWVNKSRDSETVNLREWVGAYSDRSLRDV